MAVVFTLVILKGIMLLVVFHAYLTHGKSLNGLLERREECPMSCTCYNRTVHCSSMNLRKVPFNIPPRTNALYLNDNAIDKLDFGLLSRLSRLEELHLQSNKLEGIKEKDIEFLPQLRHVDLRDNPLVCDCSLAQVMGRTLDDTKKFNMILGDTKCVAPMQNEKRQASDVLRRLDCRHRSRRGEMQCHPRYCLNGGTCIEGYEGPFCECPDSFVGQYCERPNSDVVRIFLDDITANSVKVSWRPPHHVDVEKYFVTFREQSPAADPKHFWTREDYYIFVRLIPGSFYQVCIIGYLSEDDTLDECCKEFATQPHPSRPEPGYPDHPDHPDPHFPTTESRDREDVIHKAAVILGSIIGVCAFFIICLTLVYKFRTLSNTRNLDGRSPSPPIDAEAEAETEISQAPGSENDAGRDVFVVSVPTPEQPSAPPENEVLETDTAMPDPIPINRVLHALQPPSSRGQQEAPSQNTVVLYRPENRNTVEDLSRDNPSGTAPFFIVADGNHYPLDPALSQVLCSAMSRSNIPRQPLPNEPPPPYSERAEDTQLTQVSIRNRTESDHLSNVTCERNLDASLVDTLEEDK
ncbi:uncharacterized protein LOC121412442 [Lytechinus variegatus]|uniref:uncharacterized protein LOC121412442 n=1 Tax=Lytechinus variegatus TaxID=7654 RepID=UPI001BB1933C|nr:uncharacterized protein LOC121412442 [Lytechinus variegatus]